MEYCSFQMRTNCGTVKFFLKIFQKDFAIRVSICGWDAGVEKFSRVLVLDGNGFILCP
jgi:hypothetical protein